MNHNTKFNKKADEGNYPDALSTAGIVLFVLGISLCSWLIVQAV